MASSEDWREVVADWKGESAFLGTGSKGAMVRMGSGQGENGVSPMEMLLLGAAGCTGIDITSILEKSQQDLKDLQIRVRGRRADDYPRVWKEIEITYILWGNNLDVRAVERAIQLSEEKYCSVSIMLRAVAKITTTYRILAPGEVLHESDPSLTIH